MTRKNLLAAGAARANLQFKVTEGADHFRWLIEEHAKLEHELGPPRTAATAEGGLLTLKAAAALPELGGVISIKILRAAVNRGDILGIQPGGPNSTVYVTRAAVTAWIQKCHVKPPHPASISALRASATARSARAKAGSSSTAEKKSALAAALKTARELKQR